MELLKNIFHLPRHIKNAFTNIWRNGVMSFSAIFAVTITLFLIAVFGVVAVNVDHVTKDIERNLSIYVKVDREATDEQSKQIGEAIRKIEGVSTVTFSSKEEELEKLIASQTEDNKALFESYRKDNPLGDAYIIEVVNAHDIEKVASQIEGIDHISEVAYGGSATSRVVDLLESIRMGGLIMVGGLALVTLFMIFNTIKMTIASRENEIAIMRMVGASNWYIRFPFMLEGIIIGAFGSLIPMALLYYGYGYGYELLSYFMSSTMFSLLPPHPFIEQFALALLGLGAAVGLLGSIFSLGRHLKF